MREPSSLRLFSVGRLTYRIVYMMYWDSGNNYVSPWGNRHVLCLHSSSDDRHNSQLSIPFFSFCFSLSD